jgi:3-phytase
MLRSISAVLALIALGVQSPVGNAAGLPVAVVSATTQTQEVPSNEDAADDPAIWIHPTDPMRSTIIGTNKRDGLAVYALDGRQLHYYSFGKPNNVDVRYGLPLNGGVVDIAATEDRTSHSVRVFEIQPEDGGLREITSGTPTVGRDVYGSCLYRSPVTGRFYFFVGSKSGAVTQLAITPHESGVVDLHPVRTLKLDSQVEGMVADDEAAALFIGEEKRGLWKFPAEPDGATTGILISEIHPNQPIRKADLEGLAIYRTGTRTGYLIASSQGSNEFVIFDRQEPHNPLGIFRVGPGAVDGVENTDGLEVTCVGLGPDYPGGLFVAQDGERPNGLNQNFKLVSWKSIAQAFDGKLELSVLDCSTTPTEPAN